MNRLNGKNILCIRLDNMGDLLMSSPAINALKETFHCKITVLTSSMGGGIARYIPSVDDVIVFDVPWVKLTKESPDALFEIINTLKSKQFDAAIIFTVFSQNPLPAAMLAYMAGIPVRLAYCRENPYHLLTHWLPEEEPYTYVRHQVRRDLDLVRSIGATVKDDRITLSVSPDAWREAQKKLLASGFNPDKPWMVLHTGVSEKKRQYPVERWVETAKLITHNLGYQVLLTGAVSERSFVEPIKDAIGEKAFSAAGLLSLQEFIAVIGQAPLVISVNTSTIHIAAATHTPIIVLYALTNHQHTPWKVPGKVLFFDVPEDMRSKNEILKYLRDKYFPETLAPLSSRQIYAAAKALLESEDETFIPELTTFEKAAAMPFK